MDTGNLEIKPIKVDGWLPDRCLVWDEPFDPAQMSVVVSILSSTTTLPILAQPNAGKPKLVGDQTVFEMTAVPFAAGIEECLAAGARLVGGCCGTTPEHIRAVARVLGKN